jgi:hypothetical protein
MMSKRVPHNIGDMDLFLKKAKEKHGDKYDYSLVEYTNSITKVKIICPIHGEFEQTPKSHYKCECPKCGRESQIEKAKKSKEVFIEELYNLYGDKYDYSKINYINTKDKVEIVCKKHGSFLKQPAELIKGNGCPHCKLEKSKYNNKELFIKENIKLFGDITDFSLVDEISAKKKIDLICTKHNHKFTLSVSNRLKGQKCPICSMENYRKIRTVPKEEYYRRANEVHNNEYTYTDDYITLKHSITFYCKEHGLQKRNANSHLQGAGCKKCEKHGQHKDKLTKEGYIKASKGRITILYVIRCWNEKEEFYKLGKTFRSVSERFKGILLPYEYEIISIYEGSADEIWDLEESAHKTYKDYKYRPTKYFTGVTECYDLGLPINKIIKNM